MVYVCEIYLWVPSGSFFFVFCIPHCRCWLSDAWFLCLTALFVLCFDTDQTRSFRRSGLLFGLIYDNVDISQSTAFQTARTVVQHHMTLVMRACWGKVVSSGPDDDRPQLSLQELANSALTQYFGVSAQDKSELDHLGLVATAHVSFD